MFHHFVFRLLQPRLFLGHSLIIGLFWKKSLDQNACVDLPSAHRKIGLSIWTVKGFNYIQLEIRRCRR